jgi:hypothetical protein
VVRYKSFLHQAASWKQARRVVAKVEFHCGELFPRVGFIMTNLALDNRAVVRFYNKRGTAEHWIKEGKQTVAMTRLSCHRFRANEVRLWLSVVSRLFYQSSRKMPTNSARNPVTIRIPSPSRAQPRASISPLGTFSQKPSHRVIRGITSQVNRATDSRFLIII